MTSPSAAYAVGDEIDEQVVHITRDDLRAYAELSGDHNPIHQDEDVALSVGLPGVIAHGMFTMGLVSRVLVDHIGDVSALLSFGARFTRPVVVPAAESQPGGAAVHISGKVTAVDSEAGTATFTMSASFNGQTVLGRAVAVVRQR